MMKKRVKYLLLPIAFLLLLVGIINVGASKASATVLENDTWGANPEIAAKSTSNSGLQTRSLGPVGYCFPPRLLQGSLQVTKYDSRTMTRLSGAEFTIYDKYSRVVQIIRTGSNGVATATSLPLGNYSVVETKAPPGYQVEKSVARISLCYSGQMICLSKCNVPLPTQKGCVQIIKKDEFGKVLSGAVFDVYDSTDKFVGTVTTNINGIASLGNLPYGTYKIIEIKAPTGYALDSTPRYVTISATSPNCTASITIINKKIVGSIEIIKKDEAGKALSGAEFEVYDYFTNKLVGTITTNENGVASLGNLPISFYKVIEIKAPAGYVLDSTPKLVSITSSTPNGKATVTVINKKIVGSIEIIKKDEAGKALSGAEFEVYDYFTNKLVGTMTTNENGIASLGNLPISFYKVIETKAPEGYVLDSTPKLVSITSNTPNGKATVTVINKKAVGAIEIIKKDEAGNVLSGAEFEVYDSSDKLVGTMTTNENGVASLENLPYGNYKVVETKAPAGYVLDSTPKLVSITSNTPNGKATVTVINKKAVGAIEIIKKDEAGNVLSGAEFEVYDSSDKLVGTMTTNENGVASLENLPYGNYKVVETKAPAGYVLDSTPKNLTVSKDNPNGVVSLEVINKKEVIPDPKGSLKIIKYVKGSEPVVYLPNAVFEVYNSEFELLGTYTTNNQGEILLEGLTPGDYYIVEKEAPPGYLEDTAFYKLTVEANKTAEIRHPNVLKANKGLLKIIKYANGLNGEQTDTKLSGAEFEVVDSMGAVYNVVTGPDGEVLLSDLPPGTVKVTETKAPDKYTIGGVPTKTTEIVAGETQELIYRNDPIAEGRLLVYVTTLNAAEDISGLEFVITNAKGDIYEVVTNKFGQISIYLPVGEYKIAPAGERYIAHEKTFKIEGNKLAIVNLTI